MLNDLGNIRSLEDIRLLYFKYKDTPHFSLGVVVIIILLCTTIIGRVILPQFDRWFSIQNEVKVAKVRIAVLEKNVQTLSTLNDTELTRQFNLSKQALPFEKDYTGIITTIDTIAIKTGVKLDDYSFQVGNLSTTSAKLAPQAAISVKITVKGELGKVQAFLKDLSTITPLFEVVNVSFNNSSAGLGLIFFYKYLPGRLEIPYTDPIRIVGPANLKLLETISTWSSNMSIIQEEETGE